MASGNDNLSVNGNRPAAPALSPAAKASNAVDTTLSDSWLILRKRKWIIFSAAMLGCIIGFMTALSTPHRYQAKSDIQVRPGQSDQYRLESTEASSLMNGDDISVRLETEVAILQSVSLEIQVARQLELARNNEFMGTKKSLAGNLLDDPKVMKDVLKHFKDGLEVKRIPKTELITLSFTSTNPELSARVVNTLVADYVDRSFQVRYAATQKVSTWLGQKLDDLKDEVENNQEKMIALQRQLGVIGLDDKKNLVADELEDLTKAVTDARVARIISETRFRVLESTDPNLYESSMIGAGTTESGFAAGSLLSQLRAQLATDEASLAQQSTQYGPNWPAVVQLKAQIATTKKSIETEQSRVLAESRVAFDAAKANEDRANAALNSKESEAYSTRDSLVQYAILTRRFESSRELYEGLTKRLREAGIQAGLGSSEVDIVDAALIPFNPTGPRRLYIIALGVLFGLIAGTALAFLMESLDTSLRSIAEIETVMELPSLAIIPRARRVAARSNGEIVPAYMRNIDVLAQPKSQFSESFRSLRTSLLLSTVGHPPRVVLITSSIPSEGKTTVASNIAAALSQRDVRVLLIDADLRRPTVHHRFGISSKTGLTTVLANTTTFEEAVQNIPELPNLDILPSGPVPPFPTEMIGSERMAQLLETCKGKYEHIVIDSPPILSVTDGIILARMADAVAVVMRHGGVSKHIVRRSRDLLLRAGAPVTGIILNAVDLSSPDYYGYYGYYRYSYVGSSEPGFEGDGTPHSGDSRGTEI